jgi:flagellar biosynthetic protein FliQ
MNSQDAIDIGRAAILTGLHLGSPILIVGMVAALLIGLAQAVTQVQDQTISIVPKIVAMAVATAICLPWMIQRLSVYFEELITNIPRTVGAG